MSRLVASRRLLHVAVLAAVAAAFSLIFESWVPSAAMIPLAGLLMLSILEVMLPLPVSGRRGIELGDTLLAHDETDIDVYLDGVFLPYNMVVEDGVPEALAVQQDSIRACSTVGSMQARARYRVAARRRGDLRFGPAVVHRSSVLGLLDRSVEVPIATQVTVLPPSARNLRVRVRPRPRQRHGLPSGTMRRGPGDEFFALRQYQPGDNISDVNWKASARMGRIITNEYLPDEPPRYLIYVDARASQAETEGGEDVFERSLELAAILGEALAEARAQVGLVLLSFHSQFVVPGGGAKQIERLRRMVIDAQPGYEASIHQLVLAGVAHLPARADAILITPNVYDATLAQAVSFLRTRHGNAMVLSPAFPEPVGDDRDAAASRAAATLLNAEQAAALSGISAYCDTVAQWPPGEPISVTLARLNLTGRMR